MVVLSSIVFHGRLDQHSLAYCRHTLAMYSESMVVFDGYQMSAIKDMTHQRRTKGRKGPTVSFTREMKLTVAKDLFLNDATNTSLNILAKISRQQVAQFFMLQQMLKF